jgi:protein TonB
MSVIGGTGQGFESSAPSRRIKVLLIVIALHVVIGYALLSGTARKEIAAVNQPLQAVIIQEVTIPPAPAPAQPPLQKPDVPKPKPAVVTPPLPIPREPVTPAQIAPAATMAAITQAPAPPPAANTEPPLTPPSPTAPAPPRAPPVPSSPAAPQPVAAAKPDIHIACPMQIAPQMPRQAMRDGTQGVVKAQAVIRDGTVREVNILSGPSVFHAAVRRAMLQYECTPAPIEIVVTQEFNFKFE